MTAAAALPVTPEEESSRLQAYFSVRHPGAKVELADYRRSASGFSNETRFFTLNVTQDGQTTRRELVARWAPPQGQASQYEAYDVSLQYKAMEALGRHGLPMPELVLMENDPSIIGGPFFVMVKVDGDITSDYPPGYHGAGFLFEATQAQRAQAWWRALELMARLNRIDWRSADFDFLPRPSSGREVLEARLAGYRTAAKRASDQPVPIIQEALDWLEANMPTDAELGLCWGDGRPGNIIYRDFEPVVALDWEGLNINAPENDLAWFIIVDEMAYRGHGQPRLPGLPGEAETVARYEQLLGRKLGSMDFYFVMQGAWMAIVMASTFKAATAKGITGFPEDFASNNAATFSLAQRLAQLR